MNVQAPRRESFNYTSLPEAQGVGLVFGYFPLVKDLGNIRPVAIVG